MMVVPGCRRTVTMRRRRRDRRRATRSRKRCCATSRICPSSSTRRSTSRMKGSMACRATARFERANRHECAGAYRRPGRPQPSDGGREADRVAPCRTALGVAAQNVSEFWNVVTRRCRVTGSAGSIEAVLAERRARVNAVLAGLSVSGPVLAVGLVPRAKG